MPRTNAFFEDDDEPAVYEILAMLDSCGYAGSMATTRSTRESATPAKRKPAATAKRKPAKAKAK